MAAILTALSQEVINHVEERQELQGFKQHEHSLNVEEAAEHVAEQRTEQRAGLRRQTDEQVTKDDRTKAQ
jgi:hypothetical protein